MMNGTKKSDTLIIPAKPANKAGHPAAEPVEGSSGTERNAELQSTVRTQSREAVSQAQDRIRGAVTRNKKEKLTALLHHITVDVLKPALSSSAGTLPSAEQTGASESRKRSISWGSHTTAAPRRTAPTSNSGARHSESG